MCHYSASSSLFRTRQNFSIPYRLKNSSRPAFFANGRSRCFQYANSEKWDQFSTAGPVAACLQSFDASGILRSECLLVRDDYERLVGLVLRVSGTGSRVPTSTCTHILYKVVCRSRRQLQNVGVAMPPVPIRGSLKALGEGFHSSSAVEFSPLRIGPEYTPCYILM